MDKHVDVLEAEVKRIVSVFLELKRKDKKWSQKKTEIGKRLKKLLARIEEFSGEGKD